MTQAKYSIGIDLGTTNCALSYVRLANRGERSEVFQVEQRDELNTVVTLTTLPSFLYLPTDREREQVGEDPVGVSEGWLVGLHARKQAGTTPERVVHSAKSWLAHHSVSPEAKILPWQSKAVAEGDKLSAMEASARLLSYLKRQWDERVAKRDPEAQLERQRVTITVPASFDAASQKATREAARLAGYPESVRLLEEPQAAFYRWLEAGEETEALGEEQRILVVDIGGGTSDFSLFRVGRKSEQGEPEIERIAVSDHILLGGDNIDLALAHALESELTGEDEELSADQWSHLIARSRELKERCLGGEDEARDQQLSVSLPSKGASLFAGARSTEVGTADARELLLEGFFPMAPETAVPERPTGAVLEWGLPYAPDCAVTRYLAEFLRGHAAVDAVLFNGGTLASRAIRERLSGQLAAWRGGKRPKTLSNLETDLAVARGAARYGALLEWQERPIRSGAARAIYLEISGKDATGSRNLVTVLPRGAQAEEEYTVELPDLRLAVNQLTRFQAFQGPDDLDDEVGALRRMEVAVRYTKLPALETRIEAPELEGADTLPVRLRSGVNELGLLQIACESADPRVEGSWVLDFNLRSSTEETGEEGDESEEPARIAVSPERVERARAALRTRLSGGGAQNLKGSRILKELEDILRHPKHEWDVGVSRQLTDAALDATGVVKRSEAHAESWFHVTSYVLRPGFGDPADPQRMERVWSVASEPEARAARAEVQALILWRRLAGGLSVERQERLFAAQWPQARDRKKARAERVRMLGALERVAVEEKRRFADWCVAEAMSEAREDGYPAPYLAALGNVLNRALFHAGPERVVPPEVVGEAFDRLIKLDWTEPRNADAVGVFLKAARVVEDRGLNVPGRLSKRILAKLKKSGVTEARLVPLQDYVPISRADQANAYGEALPPGLLLGG